MTVYVGVDQSLRKIGVCVLTDAEMFLSRLCPDKDLRGPERLKQLRNLLLNSLEPWRNRITAAAMEAQSLGSVGDIDQLGQISGVVQVVLTDLGVVPYLVPPALLKKFVTGHAGAGKGDMLRCSAKRWGFDFTQHSDDECDAHGLAQIAQECRESKSTIRHEREVVETLLRKRTRRKPFKRLFTKTL